jgi:hypothetical protein
MRIQIDGSVKAVSIVEMAVEHEHFVLAEVSQG